MLDDIDKIRRENGWKPRKRKREKETKSNPQSEEVKLQREAMRYVQLSAGLQEISQACTKATSLNHVVNFNCAPAKTFSRTVCSFFAEYFVKQKSLSEWNKRNAIGR